jgi:hypothetical protein
MEREESDFFKMAQDMNLYHTPQDQLLGRTIGLSCIQLGIDSAEAALLLRALPIIGKTRQTALFCDSVVTTYMEVYRDQKTAFATMERIASYLSKCAAIEEFELTVAKSTHTPPPAA